MISAGRQRPVWPTLARSPREAILNHISGHKAGVAGIYNRSTYAAEKRAALDLWANHVAVIVAQAEGANVVRLARGFD